jgi:DNA-binding transcriptional MerR regulator
MKLILRGRRFGFSLEEIRQWLLIYGRKGERQQLEHWLALADRQLVELERQRAELDVTIADLKALRATAVAEMRQAAARLNAAPSGGQAASGAAGGGIAVPDVTLRLR